MPASRLSARLLLCTALAAAALPGGSAGAERVDEDILKAGFVLNFAKFTDWPAEALENGELRICSIGIEPLSGQLTALRGRHAKGKELNVRLGAPPSEWHRCHVLFMDAANHHFVLGTTRRLGLQAVLTVGDGDGFVQAGGMIGLKLQAGRIRFDVNLEAARRAGLVLSSRMLTLADQVLQ